MATKQALCWVYKFDDYGMSAEWAVMSSIVSENLLLIEESCDHIFSVKMPWNREYF